MVKTTSEIIKAIFSAIKKNLLLIILIMAIAVSAGIGYAYYVKPVFTAYQQSEFVAKPDDSNSVNDYNYSVSQLSTFKDFCTIQNVLDRANFYIDWFLEEIVPTERENLIGDLEIFVKAVEQHDKYDLSYDGEVYLTKSQVKVNVASATSPTVSFKVIVSCDDANRHMAVVKSRLMVLAIDNEAKRTDMSAGNSFGDSHYFGGSFSLNNFGFLGLSSNVSKRKIVMVAGLLGLALSAIVVYLKELSDKTIKDKETLEKVTGYSCFAIISNNELEV